MYADATNKEKVRSFFLALVLKFASCFKQKRSQRAATEFMWKEYHKLRVSVSFKADWDIFLMDTIKQASSPVFYQFVSHKIFKEVVKARFFTQGSEDKPSEVHDPITKLEENAI